MAKYKAKFKYLFILVKNHLKTGIIGVYIIFYIYFIPHQQVKVKINNCYSHSK